LASPGPIGGTTANTGAFTTLTATGTTVNSSGIFCTNNITAYYSSDISLKENIKPIANAIFKLNTISGVEFDWTADHLKSAGGEDGYFVRKHDVGVIAQEVQKVLPEVVAERGDGYLAVRYEKMMGLVIQAINELAIEVDNLKENK